MEPHRTPFRVSTVLLLLPFAGCGEVKSQDGDDADADADSDSDTDTDADTDGDTDTDSDVAAACDAVVTLVAGANAGDTTGRPNVFDADGCSGSPGRDFVYTLTPVADGSIDLTLSTDWDAVLYVRTTCTDPTTQSECVDVAPGGTAEVIGVAGEAGVPFFVYVDGAEEDAFGSFVLSAELD